jgi:hypothetical protein
LHGVAVRREQVGHLLIELAQVILTARSTAILHKRRFSCPFEGLPAQLQPVAPKDFREPAAMATRDANDATIDRDVAPQAPEAGSSGARGRIRA